MSAPVILRALDQNTFILHEGRTLTVVGDASASGAAYRMDQVNGIPTALESKNVIASGSIVFGPYDEKQKFNVVCASGSLSVTIKLSGSTTTTTTTVTTQKSRISQYDKVLAFAGPRQINAVKGWTQNSADLQYCMALGAAAAGLTLDTDIYDSMPGFISFGRTMYSGTVANSTAKSLAIPYELVQWDLGAGQSFLLQFDGLTIGATGNQALIGNIPSSLAENGWGITVNLAGTISFNYKGNGSAGQSITIGKYKWNGTATVLDPILTDVPFALQIAVDGATRAINAWIDGVPCTINEGVTGNGYGGSSTVLNPGSTLNAVPRNIGFGYVPPDTGFVPSGVKPGAFRALRIAVLPAGQQFLDLGVLHELFRTNSRTLFQDSDYTR